MFVSTGKNERRSFGQEGHRVGGYVPGKAGVVCPRGVKGVCCIANWWSLLNCWGGEEEDSRAMRSSLKNTLALAHADTHTHTHTQVFLKRYKSRERIWGQQHRQVKDKDREREEEKAHRGLGLRYVAFNLPWDFYTLIYTYRAKLAYFLTKAYSIHLIEFFL